MIWYVEDDASIRDIAIYALNSAGFETKGFEDGLSFWEALKKREAGTDRSGCDAPRHGRNRNFVQDEGFYGIQHHSCHYGYRQRTGI